MMDYYPSYGLGVLSWIITHFMVQCSVMDYYPSYCAGVL